MEDGKGKREDLSYPLFSIFLLPFSIPKREEGIL